MSARSLLLTRLCLPAALGCWIATGCAPATAPTTAARPAAAKGDDHAHDHADHDHDHGHDHAGHDHPETLAEGIAELEKVAADVAAKLAEGAGDAADEAIHAAGHVIEDVQGLLAKHSDLAAEAKAAAEKAVADLFEAFNKVDEAMHSGAEDVKVKAAEAHESVKATIEAALTTLREQFSPEDHVTEEK